MFKVSKLLFRSSESVVEGGGITLGEELVFESSPGFLLGLDLGILDSDDRRVLLPGESKSLPLRLLLLFNSMSSARTRFSSAGRPGTFFGTLEVSDVEILKPSMEDMSFKLELRGSWVMVSLNRGSFWRSLSPTAGFVTVELCRPKLTFSNDATGLDR